MALTAGQVIALALESAHSPGKAQQAVLYYNSILSDLCQTYDFAEARGQFIFHFVPGSAPPVAQIPFPLAGKWGDAIWGSGRWGPDFRQVSAWNTTPYPGNQFGSGPYILPVDYLRLSGSSGSHGAQRSFIWWLDGVPYPVIPVDLAEFDMQVQQTGLQSFVWLSATDMSTPIDDRILLTTTGDVITGSTTVNNLGSSTRLVGGGVLGVAGQGIAPGTMLWTVGDEVAGQLQAELSLPATATIEGASLMFGYCPVVFIYPPPIDARQAMIRYQKRMPDVFDVTRYPWFHNDGYMLEKLTGKLCQLNDDDRAQLLLGGPGVVGSADQKLSLYLAMKDDEQSHPKKVELDRRVFGRQISNLGITKRVGW